MDDAARLIMDHGPGSGLAKVDMKIGSYGHEMGWFLARVYWFAFSAMISSKNIYSSS